MDFTGIHNSWDLAEVLNAAGAGLDSWFLRMKPEQNELVDWQQSTAARVVLTSGQAAGLDGRKWVAVKEPALFVHGDEHSEAVVALDYRLVWAETSWGAWARVYPTELDASLAFVHVVGALKDGARRLEELRRWLDGRG